MSVKMKYKHADFADDDTSMGSIHFTDGITSSATHIRYQTSTSMWKKRSKLEKALLILLGGMSFIILVLAFLLGAADTAIRQARLANEQLVDATPCLTTDCIRIANNILQAMDSKVDPCDDFYGYACNGWIKKNPIPEGKNNWGTFMKLEQENHLVIKHALENSASLKAKAEQKAKLYYESCLDANDTIEALGAKPLIDLIGKIGGWNMTTNYFNITTWNLQTTLQILQNKYNIGALFSYAVGEDEKNSSRHILQIDQSGLTLPTREDYLNLTEHARLLHAYTEYINKVAILLGGNANVTRRQVEDIVKFETRLANITIPNEQRRDEEVLYHNITIKELQDFAGFIDWRKFFEDALRIVKRKVTVKEEIVVYAPKYLKSLKSLIQEYEETDQGRIVLSNYLVWQTVKSFVGCLSRSFRDAYKELQKVLVGSEFGEEPQWRYCITDTSNVLGFAVGAIFVREVFQGNPKVQAETMVNEVRSAFKSNFKNLKWMDEETRRAAEIKADAISDMIGFPEFILHPDQLDEKYQSLEIRSNAYFDNNINAMQYALRKNLEKINEPVNKTTWSMAPPSVNAYYTPTKNQIAFPIGILQAPFYDSTYLTSLNYGGLGVVIGHELTHGFDDQGRQFDKNGNLHHWWNNKTIERFKQRTKCFVDQYNQFQVNGKHVNGNQTLGENMADNGGLKAAYHAYLKATKGSPDPPRLPGLNLNRKQLFFMGFAQVWCSSVTKESASLEIEKDQHSPAPFRVIGSLTNMAEFAKVFLCPMGSRMNPRDKCEIW